MKVIGYLKIIIVIGVISLLIFALRKKIKPRFWLKHFYVPFIVFIIFAILIGGIPFENLFMRFETAEDAMNYYFHDTSSMVLVNGENIAFGIKKTNEDYGWDTYQPIRRDEKGWMLSGLTDGPKSKVIFYNNCIIEWEKFEDCDEWILLVADVGYNNSIHNVNDTFNSDFIPVYNAKGNIKFYYAFVKQSSPEYYLTINGKDIKINVFDNSTPKTQHNFEDI